MRGISLQRGHGHFGRCLRHWSLRFIATVASPNESLLTQVRCESKRVTSIHMAEP